MKQKWKITFHKDGRVYMERKLLGSYKYAKEIAEKTLAFENNKSITYSIVEIV